MIEWASFFPDDTEVAALPHWDAPQLYIPADTIRERWHRSSFYPAFRYSARLFRWVIRTWAASGLMLDSRRGTGRNWPLGEFIQDVLPQADSVAVLVGTPGPTQKVIVQIWNRDDEIIGYLKYGEKPMAQKRLRQEHWILSSLPEAVGPRPLKFDDWNDGKALVLTPVEGRLLDGSLPPPDDLPAFCYRPIRSTTTAVEKHPWIRNRVPEELRNSVCPALSNREWPIVVHHGDLAPWNIRRADDGRLNAFDWEYAVRQGFPFLDAAHYILQVGFLIYDWHPEKSTEYAISYLTEHPYTDLSTSEARAVTRLAAYDGYRNSEEDGHNPERALQQWRYEIWN